MPSHEDVFPQSRVNNNEQFLFEGYRNVKSRLIYRTMSTQKSFCRDGIQKLPLSSRSTFQHAFTQTISTKTKTTQCARNREVQTEVNLDAIGSYEDRVLSPKAYLTFDMMAGSRQAAVTKIQARWRGKQIRNQNLNASGKELFIQEEDSQSKYQLKTTSTPKFFSSPYVKFWLKTKQGVYIYTEHPNAESMKKWLEILANLSHEELEVDKRLQTLLDLKGTLNGASLVSSPSAKEICTLIDREADFLHNSRGIKSLPALRKRLMKLTKSYVEGKHLNIYP